MNVQVSRETVAEVCNELVVMHADHIRETEGFYTDESDIDYSDYIKREESGGFILFVARDVSGICAGNLGFYIVPDNHSDVVQAWEDVFYVAKEFRKDGIGGMLLAYAEKYLKDKGVGYIRMTSKHPQGAPDLTGFFDHNGYEKVCVTFGKKLR